MNACECGKPLYKIDTIYCTPRFIESDECEDCEQDRAARDEHMNQERAFS